MLEQQFSSGTYFCNFQLRYESGTNRRESVLFVAELPVCTRTLNTFTLDFSRCCSCNKQIPNQVFPLQNPLNSPLN